MIVLVVVVDGLDAGRTPALNEVPTDEMPIVPPAEDDLFKDHSHPLRGQSKPQGPSGAVLGGEARRHAEWYLCGALRDAGLFPALHRPMD